MKKELLLVILVFVVAACAGAQPTQPDIGTPFVGGNVGLNLYLQNGLPPPTIFDGGTQPFAIGVVMENIGESDIGPGTINPFFQLRLEGLLPVNFGITDADLVKDVAVVLRGAKKNFDGTILPGEIYNSVYQPLNFQPNLQGNQVHPFRVVACYDYTNFATGMLCMKNDILENVQDSTICTLTGPKPVANSGGPLQVTEVIQNPMAANKLQVNIKIEHVGTGEFYGREDGETCNPSARNLNKYEVDMTVNTDDPNANIVCYRLGGGNTGTLTMYQGASQIVTCIIEGSQSSARVYQEALNVELAYRYGEFIEDQFIVQAVPG